jgi:hypothetical protein
LIKLAKTKIFLLSNSVLRHRPTLKAMRGAQWLFTNNSAVQYATGFMHIIELDTSMRTARKLLAFNTLYVCTVERQLWYSHVPI